MEAQSRKNIIDLGPVKKHEVTGKIKAARILTDYHVPKEFTAEFKRFEAGISNLKRCTRCLPPETMPFIKFDVEEVCNYCHNYKSVKAVQSVEFEYLLAFSCKRRHFCPSCYQKRVVEFGEWESLKTLYSASKLDPKTVPDTVVALQTFGNFPQGFHPHLHVLVSDGCFHANDMFFVSPAVPKHCRAGICPC